MKLNDNFFMGLALKEAWKYQGLTYPNPAVGCCIIGQNNELLAVEAHRQAGKAHAEVNALQSAYYKLTNDETILSLSESVQVHNYLKKNHNKIFENCKLYTTLEPCSHFGKTPSCASLIAHLGIKNVFVGSSDTNKLAENGNKILQDHGCNVYTEIMKKECDELLYPFQKSLTDKFIFFKWAQRLNGTTDDGVISSEYSRKNVHAMRDVCDLLVIGGNTVREDRPTLDARLIDGKAPDILIFSRQKEFDKTIPLFSVEDRKVFIENDFSKLSEYKNIMIEGSAKMYELSRDVVDYYLCYLALTFGGESGFENLEDKFEVLNIEKEDKDIIMWMKRI
jgi:diaminohydroxyphosphoribosylaminopyrimidine deaminase / 5-amino-6-(5-phosphoribosylamino)uracil reductase